MLHFGILQQKCQVGDCGGEERGDQAAIDLILIGVNFLWMTILKFFLSITVKKPEADITACLLSELT